jgi:hypothetical protein
MAIAPNIPAIIPIANRSFSKNPSPKKSPNYLFASLNFYPDRSIHLLP